MNRAAFLVFAIVGALSTSCEKVGEDSQTSAYVDRHATWNRQQIQVCWENVNPADPLQLAVRNAVRNTWGAVTPLRFVGWGNCRPGDLGVRIGVADVGPHVIELGNRLDGLSDGVILNNTFNNWNSAFCQANLNFCIEAIAVHEFGHVLGFAHEHNRPDRPSTCTDAPQGPDGTDMIGPFDNQSVMNYCNPTWNNGGVLSAGDIAAAQRFYGTP